MQHEEAERAHSPALSIHRAGNFQEMQMPWGRQGFAEVGKPLSLGTAPLKPSLFSGNASCPPERSLSAIGSSLILNYFSARDSE